MEGKGGWQDTEWMGVSRTERLGKEVSLGLWSDLGLFLP